MSAKQTIGGAQLLLLAIAGFIIWASAFAALYGMQGLGCALGLQRVVLLGSNLLTILLVLLWIGHLALTGVLLWFCIVRWRPRRAARNEVTTFLAVVTCLTTASAVAATFYIGVPVLLLPPCG